MGPFQEFKSSQELAFILKLWVTMIFYMRTSFVAVSVSLLYSHPILNIIIGSQ